MARGMNFTIEVVGADDAADNLDQVSHRLRNARDAFEDVLDVIEAGHEAHFKRLKGRYVRTGTLKESLTTPNANGALRELHGDGAGLTFGTSVFYAQFLTKRRKDPDTGQLRPRSRRDKSAVLSLTKKTKQTATQLLLDHITEPLDD